MRKAVVRIAPIAAIALFGALQACAPRETRQTAVSGNKVMSYAEFVRLDDQTQPPLPPAADCDAACRQRRQELRYVVYVGKQIYCYWDLKRAETGTDFDALAQQLEQSITRETTPTQYYATLRRWASAFHDGHVNALMKDDRSDIEIYTAAPRLEVLAPATDHEKVVVADPNGASGLSAGDAVTAINGVPAAQALDSAEATVSGSTRRMRRFFASRRLVDVLGADQGYKPLVLAVAPVAGGDPRTVTLFRSVELDPQLPRNADGSPAAPSGPEPTGVDNFKATILPGGIGYLRIDAFVGAQSKFLLDQLMGRLLHTSGLLIDVRKNGGGDQSGDAVLARLAAQTVTRYRTSERMDDFILSKRPENYFLSWNPGDPFAAWHDRRVSAAQLQDRYLAPVVELTSPNCFSACDTFTAALRANHLATIVGEATGGGTGTPLVFDLPVSGHQFRYSVVRGMAADGAPIEGVGTSPDAVIEPTQQDRAQGRDTELLEAIAVLRQKIDAANAPQPGPSASPEPGASSSPSPEPSATPSAAPSATPSPGVDAGSMARGALPDPAEDAALVEAVRDLGQIWKQDTRVSPTTADELELRRVRAVDEL